MIAFSLGRTPIRVDPVRVALAGILLMAFAIRIYGWNWDDGNYLHPDERHIVSDVMIGRIHWPESLSELTDPATSGLNPRSADPESGDYREFAYGAMPVLLTDLAAEVLGWFTATDWHSYEHAYKVGRPLSALLDTLTVILVFLIGSRIGGRRVGILAAFVAALTPLTIQLAHFFTTDSWLTFFVTLCLYCSLRAAENGAVRWFMAAGATFGWAMACKGSVFTLAAVVGVAGLYHLWWRSREGDDRMELLTVAASRLAVSGGAALLAFAMFEPYALLRPDIYRKSLETQAEIVRGVFDVPFTRQYIGTTPILYQIEQLFRWELGPVTMLLAIAGALLLVWRQRRGVGAGAVVLLTWLAIYGVVISVPEAKFIRYLAPVVPVLAVLAGVGLDAGWRIVGRVNRQAGMAFAALALAGIGFWGASFASIYAEENTRLEASAWIYANVPAGSVLNDEYWDDQLPKDLGPGLNGTDRQYASVTFDLYADRVSYRDLMDVAAAFEGQPLLQEAGAALRNGDFAAAGQHVRSAGRAAVGLEPLRRDPLQRMFELLGAELDGPVGALGGACRDAAAALREDPEAVEEAFGAVANELIAANENEAANYLYRNLAEVDYYVISSNRVMSAMPRSPWRYPVQTRFYEALESGDLGFTLVADFHRYPGIGPIRFDDDGADESWLNYDHPHVWIYQKSTLVDRPAYDALMLDVRMQEVTPQRYPESGDDLMLDEPVGNLDVVDDARWSAAWTENSVVAFLFWIVLLVVLQLAAWPWARLVFGRFADGGWSFSRLLTLLLAGYLVWLGASVEVISFRAVWAWIALIAVAAAGWGIRWRWRRLGGGWGLTPEQRRTAIAAEVVFWGVFGLFLVFRYLNPDSWHPVWGGEKPMEFAHLNATLRSARFPPYDPWFAGGYINYYYYGLYLVAFCLKLTGIPSEIGFNLAQPTVIATIAMTGFGVAATLGRDLARRAVAIPAGLIGALLLVGIGNLDEFFRWLDQPSVRDFGNSTWGPTRVIDPGNTITEFPYFTGLYADLHAHAIALPITILAIALAYSLARDPWRVRLATGRPRREPAAVVIVGSRLLLLALSVGTLFATNAWDVATYVALGAAAMFMATAAIRSLPARIIVFGGAVAVMGALAYGLFLPFHSHYVALFSSIGEVREQSEFWEFSRHLGGLLAIVGVGSVAWLARRGGRDAGLPEQPGLAISLIVVAAGVRGVLPDDQNGLRDAMTVLLLAVAVVILLGAAWIGVARDADGVDGQFSNVLRVGLGLVGIVALGAIATDRAVVGLMVAVAGVAGVIWLTDQNVSARFMALMIGGAAAIVAGTEVIFLVDNLEGVSAYRMNTVFKFYNQVWVLLALAGGAFVAWMLATWLAQDHRHSEGTSLGVIASPPEPEEPIASADDEAQPRGNRVAPVYGWVQSGVAVAAVVIGLSLFYPALATMPRLEQRFTDDLGSETLNGLDWMEYGTIHTQPDGAVLGFKDDRAAIEWFNENVAGSPVIAEASIGAYRCNGSRISIGTGLPTIIGWLNHETQQRYPDGLGQTESDVAELYRSSDIATKESILARYGVEYVVVGPLERLGVTNTNVGCTSRPSPAGIAAFEQMVGSSLEIAFQQGETTVYRVVDLVDGDGS